MILSGIAPLRKAFCLTDQQVLDDYIRLGRNASTCANEWGVARRTAQERVTEARRRLGHSLTDQARPEHINRVQELLDRSSIDPAGHRIKNVRLNAWGTAAKDADGNIQTEGLHSTRINLVPQDEFPKWPVVQPAKPAIIKYAPRPVRTDKLKRAFIIPDAQIGFFRSIKTGALEPFHDLRAIDAMLQMLRVFQPERIVILGDFLDVASLSKYLQIAEFQLTLQPSIEYAYRLLAEVRSAVGKKCKIDYIEGNHERRVAEYIQRNAASAYGLRRAGNPEWPQLSIPALLRFDELGIMYSDAYPGGQVWLTKNLVCQHAPPTKKNELRASVIHGHTPYNRVESRSIHYYDRIEEYSTTSVGGLMRVDEVTDPGQLVRTSVPSDRTRVGWTQGVAAVYIHSDDRFRVDLVPIQRGFAIFEQKCFQGVNRA